jgi:hypothetical protein
VERKRSLAIGALFAGIALWLGLANDSIDLAEKAIRFLDSARKPPAEVVAEPVCRFLVFDMPYLDVAPAPTHVEALRFSIRSGNDSEASQLTLLGKHARATVAMAAKHVGSGRYYFTHGRGTSLNVKKSAWTDYALYLKLSNGIEHAKTIEFGADKYMKWGLAMRGDGLPLITLSILQESAALRLIERHGLHVPSCESLPAGISWYTSTSDEIARYRTPTSSAYR